MNRQDPYSGYNHAGPLPDRPPPRPPVPGAYGAPPMPMMQGGRPTNMQPHFGGGGGGGGQQPSYNPPPPMYGGGGPPPGRPPMPPQLDGRPPNVPTNYGAPIHFDGGRPRPPDAGFGGPSRPMGYPPSQRPSFGGARPPTGNVGPPPPNQYNSPTPFGNSAWGGSGGDDQQQPRKRSRVEDGGTAPPPGGAARGGSVDKNNPDAGYSDFLNERLRRERPGRTLFVRNVDFRADVATLRAQFEAFGEMKNWFDRIESRGLAFVSYYDLRAAEAAKNAMQGTRINTREIDVHYSLPREGEMDKRCDRDKDQGTLFVVLKSAPEDLKQQEFDQIFAQFGELKNIRVYKDQFNCRFVEYWDCRGTKAAHDALIGTQYRGGTWDLKFAWDLANADRMPDMAKHQRDRDRLQNLNSNNARPPPQPMANNNGNFQGGGGGGPQGYGPTGAAGGPGMYPSQGAGQSPAPGYGNTVGGAGSKRPHDYDSGNAEPPMRRWGQQQPGAGQAQGYGSPNVRPLTGAPQGIYSPPTQQQGGASQASGAVSDNRLEQAQKVQQLLASLKPGGGIAGNVGSPAGQSGQSANAGGAKPGGTSAAPGLPDNIAALLQMAQNKSGAAKK